MCLFPLPDLLIIYYPSQGSLYCPYLLNFSRMTYKNYQCYLYQTLQTRPLTFFWLENHFFILESTRKF